MFYKEPERKYVGGFFDKKFYCGNGEEGLYIYVPNGHLNMFSIGQCWYDVDMRQVFSPVYPWLSYRSVDWRFFRLYSVLSPTELLISKVLHIRG